MRCGAQCQYARYRQSASMADAEPPISHPQGGCSLSGAAGELYLRCGARLAVDNHVGECDTRAEASPERLEHRLLGGKTPGQALDSIDRIADFIKFGLHETAREQGISRILDPTPYLCDFDQIDAVADDVHRIRPPRG